MLVTFEDKGKRVTMYFNISSSPLCELFCCLQPDRNREILLFHDANLVNEGMLYAVQGDNK